MAQKVIICSPQLGISPGSNLGGEVYDREIINEMCNQGAKVIVILPRNKPYIPNKNLKVYYLPFSHIWPPYLFNLFIVPWLFWLYKKEKFNIVRVHSPYFVGLGALFFRFFYPKFPLLATYHHLENKKPIFQLLDRFLIKKWDAIFTDSNFVSEEINKKYSLKKEHLFLTYLGVDHKFKPKKRDKDLERKYSLKGKKVLLFLGQLSPRKNLDFLLRLFSRFELPKVKLLIAGEGNLASVLKAKAKELKITDKVVFTGLIKEGEKVDIYNLAHIFLYPSYKEGFGLAVLEAAACAVPSVVSNTSSLREVVQNGKTGYWAQLNNLYDWQKKIKRLLNNEAERKIMGKKARQFSQQFSWEKAVKKQTWVYKKILNI